MEKGTQNEKLEWNERGKWANERSKRAGGVEQMP